MHEVRIFLLVEEELCARPAESNEGVEEKMIKVADVSFAKVCGIFTLRYSVEFSNIFCFHCKNLFYYRSVCINIKVRHDCN